MATPKGKNVQTYKDYLKASAPVNHTGKTSYGVSHIPGKKVQKTLQLNEESAKRLMEIAKATGLTQIEVVYNLLMDYDKYQPKG